MSFVSWLRTRLLPRSPPTAVPPQANLCRTTPQAMSNPEATDTTGPDTGVRMHIAAHDPDFPAKRDAAVATIVAAIDAVALAHGFTKKPKSWAKTGALGTVSIHLQRNRYGFDCTINLGFQPRSGLPHGPWAQDGLVSLDRFCRQNLGDLNSPKPLIYLDVLENADTLCQPMAVLSNQALPWLLAHLTNPDASDLPIWPMP